MNRLHLHELTRSQAYDYRLLLLAQEVIDHQNNTAYELSGDAQMWVDPAKRNLPELAYQYAEAMKRASNLAFSFVLTDLDQYQWFLALANTYRLAKELLPQAVPVNR